MFPNHIEFFGRERHEQRFQEVEQIQLERQAKLQRECNGNVLRWLGRHMMMWGLRLQGYQVQAIQHMEENLQFSRL